MKPAVRVTSVLLLTAIFIAGFVFARLSGRDLASVSAASRSPHATLRRVAATSARNSAPPAAITVSLHPKNAPVTSAVTQQFTAVVKNSDDQQVTWYVGGVKGGNAKLGTIDATGLYTPPANFVIKTHTIKAVSHADPTKSGKGTVYLVNYPGTYTNRSDNSRTGQNLQETVLTPANVTVSKFGKLFSYPTDGGVQAQPLYVANVNLPSPLNGAPGYHNVAYVATEHDSVFAYDADGKVSGALWQASFINPPNVVTIPGTCFGIAVKEIGITATPVIDPSTNTLYVEVRTLENPTGQCNGTYVHRLHALDITTGQEKFGGPVVVQASVPGTGVGSSGGVLAFDPQHENVRAALVLTKSSQDTNSVVYFAAASLVDEEPYHGWVLGYDSQTLAQKYVFCATPNGKAGGIWQMGSGLAADSDGNVYAVTGNGSFFAGNDNYGETVLKLTPNNGVLTLGDFFTPSNYKVLNSHDWDMSSGGLLLLPPQPGNFPNLIVAGGKEGTIYLINRDNLGGFNDTQDNIVQEVVGAIKGSIPGGQYNGIWSASGYFQNNVYIFGRNDFPKMFTLNNGLLPETATSAGPIQMKNPSPVVSANGADDGILWVLQTETRRLWAFDPNDLTHQLYDSFQRKGRDGMSGSMNTITPTVANGRVYIPTNSELDVFGLLQ